MEAIAFAKSSASVEDIARHLSRCGPDFIPPLEERVNLVDYSIKLSSNALTYEAWLASNLVGLVAVYFNLENRTAFVSSVSVENGCRGHGIATRLIRKAIADASRLRLLSVKLEVNVHSVATIRLYKTEGFSVYEVAEDMLCMIYLIDEK